ncbi:c-type cytochrome [Teichococcus vastitatis]|uniref:C-type cytochrome n=1 Tax=Teichococcus vastitatis TaxID=2307076 RepID=A0ABS9W4C7_9PROT|nr:c-type cytochrome [Pseudoroseomonas vastitatis]MCI0753720.1 c-type cytochrome [Pseudoroseomonas vastitatis]
MSGLRLAILGLALLAPAVSAVAQPATQAAAPDAAAKRGAEVVAERSCGACHGEQGVSAMPGIPSLAGQQREFIALQLVLFREGLRDIPAMQGPVEGLTDEQLEELGAYFASLPHAPPPDRAARDQAAFEAGAALSEQLRCGVCHLPALVGQNQVPHIAGQREDYLAGTLKAYRDGTRHGTDTQMNGVVQGLSDAQIDQIAHYVSQR